MTEFWKYSEVEPGNVAQCNPRELDNLLAYAMLDHMIWWNVIDLLSAIYASGYPLAQ